MKMIEVEEQNATRSTVFDDEGQIQGTEFISYTFFSLY